MPSRLTSTVLASVGWMSIALLAVACIPGANAQAHGASFGGPHPGFGSGGRGGHGRGGRPVWLGDPLWYSDYYPSEGYDASETTAIIVLQQPAPPPAQAPQPQLEPLMIEWRGDHYERSGGSANRDEPPPARGKSVATDYARADQPVQVASDTLQPTILIYRDGRREEVPQYAIVGSSMYAKGDYWRDGYWTKTVQLSQLDIPATIQANQQRGIKFVLPGGPNEVVTRP